MGDARPMLDPMRGPLARALRRVRGPAALPRSPANRAGSAPVDEGDAAIIARAAPYTMTGEARLQALVDAVRYCVARAVPGDFAECGVWRGGSVLAMILTLQDLGVEDRDIHLFDTFDGMTEPTEHDVSPIDPPARQTWDDARAGERRPWGELFDPELFNEEVVRETLLATGYPERRLHLVRGPVEETLPRDGPERLALLRLDTDWYESTRHELVHLYPRLASRGVLILDDYGWWGGARRAVDEYVSENDVPLLLNRVDYTARITVKP